MVSDSGKPRRRFKKKIHKRKPNICAHYYGCDFGKQGRVEDW